MFSLNSSDTEKLYVLIQYWCVSTCLTKGGKKHLEKYVDSGWDVCANEAYMF